MRNVWFLIVFIALAVLYFIVEDLPALVMRALGRPQQADRLPRRVRMQMNDAHYKLNRRVRAHERHKLPMGLFRRTLNVGARPSPCGG